MPEPNLFQIFTTRLNKFNIPYIVTGAVASIIYGEPRLTRDIDLVVELTWLASPEYVILRKLDYYREGKPEKHLRDIAGMIEISSAQINFDQLQNKIKDYSLEKEWREAQKMIKK